MKRKLSALGAALVVAATLGVAVAAAQAPPQDENWLQMSISGDRFEIAGGKIALKRATRASNRTLAQRLINDHSKSLHDAIELAHRTGCAKATAFRLARTLQARGFVVQNQDSSYRLGPRCLLLATGVHTSFDVRREALPTMEALRDATGETVQLTVLEGFDVKVAKFPFTANGKAHGLADPTGFVKVISDAKYGELLGAHLIGPEVTELLPELTLAQKWDLTTKELARNVHAHPTLSEALQEAFHGLEGHMINF